MSTSAVPKPQADADRLRLADQAISACGGDARDAVKALIVSNEFLESAVSSVMRADIFSRGSRSTQYNRYARGHVLRGIAAGEATECFNPNGAVMRAEALARKEGHVGAVAFSRTGDLPRATLTTRR